MRLPALDHGHTGGAKWLLRLLGARAPDVVKTLMYRPRFFGRRYSAALHDVMRGPSDWSVGERELFAAYTSRLNQCPF